MTLFELLKNPKQGMQRYKRKDWDEYLFVYMSDLDFTLLMNDGVHKDNDQWSYVPDMLKDDWEYLKREEWESLYGSKMRPKL